MGVEGGEARPEKGVEGGETRPQKGVEGGERWAGDCTWAESIETRRSWGVAIFSGSRISRRSFLKISSSFRCSLVSFSRSIVAVTLSNCMSSTPCRSASSPSAVSSPCPSSFALRSFSTKASSRFLMAFLSLSSCWLCALSSSYDLACSACAALASASCLRAWRTPRCASSSSARIWTSSLSSSVIAKRKSSTRPPSLKLTSDCRCSRNAYTSQSCCVAPSAPTASSTSTVISSSAACVGPYCMISVSERCPSPSSKSDESPPPPTWEAREVLCRGEDRPLPPPPPPPARGDASPLVVPPCGLGVARRRPLPLLAGGLPGGGAGTCLLPTKGRLSRPSTANSSSSIRTIPAFVASSA